jgi:PAS domain S-box-containing protein
MTGYPEGELLGQSAQMLYFSQEEYDRVGREKYARMAEEGTGSIETRWRKKDGGAIDILLSSTPLDPANHSLGVIFTALDITRRKESERASSAGEERYRQLIERSFTAVIVHKNEKIVLANDAACRVAGVQSRDELIGQPVISFVHPDCRRLVIGRMKKMLAKPGTAMPLVRQTFCRKSGEPVEVEVMATSFPDKGTPAIQVIFREITDRARQETLLKESEERYRTLAESAADMIYITDCTGNIVYANTLCARMYGCAPADLVGRKQTDLFLPEIAHRHLANIRKVVTKKEPIEHVEDVITPVGKFRIDIKLSPIFSPDGTVVSVVGIARDVTARQGQDPGGK